MDDRKETHKLYTNYNRQTWRGCSLTAARHELPAKSSMSARCAASPCACPARGSRGGRRVKALHNSANLVQDEYSHAGHSPRTLTLVLSLKLQQQATPPKSAGDGDLCGAGGRGRRREGVLFCLGQRADGHVRAFVLRDREAWRERATSNDLCGAGSSAAHAGG